MSITEERQHTKAPWETAAPAAGTSADVRVTGRRVMANLIDGVILVGVGAGIMMATGVQTTTAVTTSGTSTMWQMSPTGTVLYAVFALAYYVLMERFLGRTVGKMCTGIRVVGETSGATPTWGQAFIRTLLRVVDGMFGYLVAFIVVLTNDRRRRVGDMAAKTLVVRS
ncbi:putative RDD family membrane protein YckC [Catenuloplanes nepalensis]|uniref:RDD family membrane protein YckC n=1 Tax=Catenuloplanes nepalensis TaxID=587533 RepID=A0ABT9MN10_9ACTN|nr:RDD family protein [Catenuloplanes nepalensis]MDP9792815.1 putative RDD family membrane protein YckC [Catenuloplanes nepalensis]